MLRAEQARSRAKNLPIYLKLQFITDYYRLLAMLDTIALLVLVLWPIIPLWWIPVHGANKIVRKMGFFVCPVIGILWVTIAYIIYTNRVFFLGFNIDFFILIRAGGILWAAAGVFLQLWTLRVLNFLVITGAPEIFDGVKAKLSVRGPFSYIRHPTYLSHTMFFLGVFLITGNLAIGLVALIDFLTMNFIVIPLEEKELLQRFGIEYKSYMARVPRFIPRLNR